MIDIFPKKQDKLLACYFPTTVVFVDDSKDFLKTMHRIINPLLSRRMFNDASEALHFFTSDYIEDSFTGRCLKVFDPDEIAHKTLDINLEIIREEIYKSTRFEQISVLCVDHSMPSLTGLELCEKIKNNNIKKILLTGVAGTNEAVAAFNSGIIDCYIVKGETDWEKKLNSAIFELQYSYFSKKSSIIIDCIIEKCGVGVSCLDDLIFIELFQKIAKEVQAVEYYIHDETGSYLFLDFNGKPSYLAVMNEKQMDDFYEVCLDWELPKKLSNAVKNREMAAYFHNENDYNVDDLTPFFHPVTPLEGKKSIYYYSLIKSPIYDIQPSKVLTYKDFLKKN